MNKPLRILIADDNHSDRLILQSILTKSGHQVFTAEDGQQAVDLFVEHQPNIVLLDALMPVMDGYDAARAIKSAAGEQLVPIIFLTSLRETEALARCLEVGGDDFLTKPYNKLILQAKLNAFYRLQQLYETVAKQRDEIKFHTDRLVQEQDVAKKVFDNIAHPGCLNADNIKYVLSPMYVFNGDVLLAAEKPSGGLHVLLGDFTGHGLPAAIGAMPVSEIFYGMTLKGFALNDILSEINSRLKEILPTGVFCCAIGADIDFRQELIHVWNGGMPEGFLLKADGELIAKAPSRNLPLGVLGPERFSTRVQTEPFPIGSRVFMTSDGLAELDNGEGLMFGHDRVEQVVSAAGQMSVVDAVIHELSAFMHKDAQSDDLTFVEVIGRPPQFEEAAKQARSSTRWSGPQDWHLEYELRPQALRTFDPLPMVLQMLMESPGLRSHRGRVFTILAELYSNALDHGVLGLDSSLKASPEGFAEYYQTRIARLETLREGYVRFGIEHQPTADGGRIIMRLNDSGEGFDWRAYEAKLKLDGYSGRGLPLIRSLCESFEYEGNGNTVCAVYKWTVQE